MTGWQLFLQAVAWGAVTTGTLVVVVREYVKGVK